MLTYLVNRGQNTSPYVGQRAYSHIAQGSAILGGRAVRAQVAAQHLSILRLPQQWHEILRGIFEISTPCNVWGRVLMPMLASLACLHGKSLAETLPIITSLCCCLCSLSYLLSPSVKFCWGGSLGRCSAWDWVTSSKAGLQAALSVN